MTVQEFIEMLQTYPKDAEVMVWDEEREEGWVEYGDYGVYYDEQYNRVQIS